MQKWEHARLHIYWHDELWVSGEVFWNEDPREHAPNARQTWKRGWYYTDRETGEARIFSALRELDTWLGAEGWELVSVTPEVTGWASMHAGATTTHSHWLYFKRPAPD